VLKGCDAEIVRIFAEVLEKQVFLFPDPIDASELSAAPEKLLASSMTFTGKYDGGLVLAVPEALARTIAANFLGMDEDDPIVEEHGSDSLGEILNVICGHLLTALYGRDEVFDLSIPRPFTLTGEEAAILARKKDFYAFAIDEHQVLLQASFCNPIPGEAPNAYG
jgi:CheY-specific phosphatase CheX